MDVEMAKEMFPGAVLEESDDLPLGRLVGVLRMATMVKKTPVDSKPG